MESPLRSPCRLPAVEGLGRWRSSQKVRVAFRGFSTLAWRSLLCEGALRQQPGPSSLAHRGGSECGFKLLCAHRSRPLSRAGASHSWAGTAQSASPTPRTRQVRVHGRWLKQSRSGTAWPNPSIKPSPNSKTPGPRCSACHHLQRGPGVFLLVPAYVER